VTRLFISLIGIALVLWSVGTVVLGLVGAETTAVITAIRRQGGQRNETIPNRYTYVVSYTFETPDGRRLDGFTYRIGNAVYVKATGNSTAPVRYLTAYPGVNALAADTWPSLGKAVLLLAGGFLVYVMNLPHRRKRRAKGKG